MHLLFAVLLLAAYLITPCSFFNVPVGIFCSCPPTNSRSNSVISGLSSLRYVDGVLVRVGWADLEPVKGIYNWTLLDNQFALAATANLKVSLAIIFGPSAPSWLYLSGGVVQVNSTQGTIPLPWDASYLSFWTAFIA